MAQNDEELEQEESGGGGGFERFLLLMVPILFTLVLLGVLLTLFNMDIRNSVFAVANKIPFVERFVPDPPTDPGEQTANDSKQQEKSSEATIKQLKEQLSQKDAELQKLNEEKAAQQQNAATLQTELDKAKADAAAAQQTEQAEDPYEKQLKDVAKLYASMKASKAAPILENLTTDEVVQIFSVMNNDSRRAILEKMDPKKAAEVSLKMKDSVDSSDQAIAALQSRLKQDQQTAPATTPNLDQTALGQTFEAMKAEEAAKLLGEMYAISPGKVLTILKSVSDSSRSSILDAMTAENSARTAKIVNRLMGGS